MRQAIFSSIIIIIICFFAICAQAKEGEFSYNSNDKRDPFSPLVSSDGRILFGARTAAAQPEQPEMKMALEGVIWDPEGKSLAIINGTPVKEQERILGLQVLKIKKDSVILQKEGKVFVINLTKGGADEAKK